MTGHSPQDTVERALQAARCDDCLVIADETSSANLRWAGNSLTTNGIARSRQLTVIAISRGGPGASAGVVSRAGVTGDQVADLVAEAEKAAADGPTADDAMPLIEPAAAADPGHSGRPGWDAEPGGTQIGVFAAFADALGSAFEVAASGGRKLYGYAEHSVTSTFLGSSAGLRLRHDQPAGRALFNAKSADLERSSWAGAGTRDFADIDVAALEASLARQLDWATRRVELPAGRYETILPPAAMADLLLYLYLSAGAKDALDGRSVFSKAGRGTRVGEQLTGVPLTLRSDPDAAGLECGPFVVAHASSRDSSVFDNGLALGPTEWISGGRLAALTQTRHSAGLSGLAVTPMITNLILEAADGAGSLQDMISRTKRGLLPTSLWYIREVDAQSLLLTGLTRDGVYLIENGEITAAVNNFRFNESPVAMLSRIVEAGTTAPALAREFNDFFSRTAMPPVRVEGFNMSSVSQAS
jgi:predicted Zn-dependent protease